MVHLTEQIFSFPVTEVVTAKTTLSSAELLSQNLRLGTLKLGAVLSVCVAASLWCESFQNTTQAEMGISKLVARVVAPEFWSHLLPTYQSVIHQTNEHIAQVLLGQGSDFLGPLAFYGTGLLFLKTIGDELLISYTEVPFEDYQVIEKGVRTITFMIMSVVYLGFIINELSTGGKDIPDLVAFTLPFILSLCFALKNGSEYYQELQESRVEDEIQLHNATTQWDC